MLSFRAAVQVHHGSARFHGRAIQQGRNGQAVVAGVVHRRRLHQGAGMAGELRLFQPAQFAAAHVELGQRTGAVGAGEAEA